MEKEQKIKIEGLNFEGMQDFMSQFLKEHPELENQIRLEKLEAKDVNGVLLKPNQELKQLSTGNYFKIDENRIFRNFENIEVDFQHNDENIYEDLEVVSIKF
jgi:hypothetical protein